MEDRRALLVERLTYLALVAGLQWNVLREGYFFAQKVQQVVKFPGLKDEGSLLGWNDLSDYQWRSFRSSAPLLALSMAAFVVTSQGASCLNPTNRQILMVLITLTFLGALHGACALHVLLLTTGAYALSRYTAGRRYGLVAVWGYACGTLLLARMTDGLPFGKISPDFRWLDRHRGLLRWHIHYNLLVLRLISFASDLHWAKAGKRQPNPRGMDPTTAGNVAGGGYNAHGGDSVTVTAGVDLPGGVAAANKGNRGVGNGAAVSDGVNAELRARVETPLPLPYYSLLAFLEYTLYPPLYIAGPIITFNSFASQRMWRRVPQLGPARVLLYWARAAATWACLELVTHALPYNSIATHRILDWLAARSRSAGAAAAAAAAGITGGWPSPQPLHYAITGYWVLLFMWLKFTVIWRFFRGVALADGIVPPENMTRCVCNNYDVEGFWRSWHASYNRWLVRYMYVPLGGNRWRALNVWPIFTFVALWHDLEWRLLGWAWIMAAGIAPEMAIKAFGRSAMARRWHGTAVFRHTCALAAAVNILLLMAGNLVGFVVGVDGIWPLLQQVLGQPRFLAVVLLALFSAAQLMFWKRETEAEARKVVSGSAL